MRPHTESRILLSFLWIAGLAILVWLVAQAKLGSGVAITLGLIGTLALVVVDSAAVVCSRCASVVIAGFLELDEISPPGRDHIANIVEAMAAVSNRHRLFAGAAMCQIGMKRFVNHVLACALFLLSTQSAPAAPRAEVSKPEPTTYELSLIYIFEATPTEFLLVIGNSGFKTVASLERFIATLPPGTTLRWSPGCERLGGEPLLSSEREMASFVSFCREHQINFVLVPSG